MSIVSLLHIAKSLPLRFRVKRNIKVIKTIFIKAVALIPNFKIIEIFQKGMLKIVTG